MNRPEAVKHIIMQAGRGELVFPANVHASLQLQRALDDPTCSLETAAQLIIAEPVLAARVVAIANSVAYARFGGAVSNVRNAVSILGFRTLQSIVAAIVIRQIGSGITDPKIQAKATQLWQQSAQTASIARSLAAYVGKIDPETALFAGIVHAVGGFYLLSRAEEFPSLLEPQLLNSSNGDPPEENLSALVNRAILQKLMVPKEVRQAIEFIDEGHSVLPPSTLGELLWLSKCIATASAPLEGAISPSSEQMQACLDCELAGKTVAQHLQESEAARASLISVLVS
jgi:HD-like signal output (HDOD) protein